MTHITITYNQRDAQSLQSILKTLHNYGSEILTKKCMHTIPGLVSHSFQYPAHTQLHTIQALLTNKPVWIKYGSKVSEELQLIINDSDLMLMNISFGYFTTNMTYSWSKQLSNSRSLKCKLNTKHKYIAVSYAVNRQLVELRLTQECLDKYFIISTTNAGVYRIILPLKASPRCYTAIQRRMQCYKRTLTFADIDEACLSNSSAVCLQFMTNDLLDRCKVFLINVIKLDCHYGLINCTETLAQAPDFGYTLRDFWSYYAYQMLLTLGDRLKNQLTINILYKISRLSSLSENQQYPQHQCYLKLMAVYYRARNNRFFDINEEFDKIQPIPLGIVMDKWAYVPRVYLTPYGLYPLAIRPMRENRILRERNLFGPAENFCRVIIRDVDLAPPQNDFMQINEQWIKNLILGNQSIRIGDRQFYFLLCSNSQLRDRSFWFHAPYKDRKAENIRQWMGDFSHETCVGTRIARMALSLTGTTATIQLSPHQMERIEDRMDGHGRPFTDGVGKISPEALRQALIAYNPDLIADDYMPCVIQARLNGIKGVFVKAPDLADRGVLIQYRPSQHKFTVNHNILEIVKHASSSAAFLNRQVIVLLENMGVPEHIFVKLQNKARIKISMSLLANRSAQHTLEQTVRLYDWERMRQSGIQLTREPFTRSLLLLLAQDKLRRLKERSHIRISHSDGRMLFGVVDETNSLQYGQVFIQLRDLNGECEIIHHRKILITKNPAHFPGDVRILDAVDCPALHHLHECVVFPAHGLRPHPNEISGSDLDGDEYWVCWNKDLVNNVRWQYSPATFDSAEKQKHPGEITMNEIADFLYKYLSSDSLGALSNRHLACCARYDPNHEDSLSLAKIISQAVDFPKTGVLPQNPTDIRIIEYPDFMENKYKKSFESKSSTGTMYRQVQDVWQIHLRWHEICEEEQVDINNDFLIEGYQNYIDEAEEDYQYYSSRINAMLSIYNLENEYELITGCHLCPEEEKKNNDSVETASLEFRHLVQEMRNHFQVNRLSHMEQLQKASAWYYVAYRAGTILSFGWIMNRFMSAIVKHKDLPQEEHQALKRIGKAIRNSGFVHTIKKLARMCNIGNGGFESSSETEILGWQFLQIIDQTNDSTDEQELTRQFLIFLHKVALNIL